MGFWIRTSSNRLRQWEEHSVSRTGSGPVSRRQGAYPVGSLTSSLSESNRNGSRSS